MSWVSLQLNAQNVEKTGITKIEAGATTSGTLIAYSILVEY